MVIVVSIDCCNNVSNTFSLGNQTVFKAILIANNSQMNLLPGVLFICVASLPLLLISSQCGIQQGEEFGPS